MRAAQRERIHTEGLQKRIRDLEAAGNDLRASLVGMCSINNVMPDSCAARIKRFDDLFSVTSDAGATP
jgi:hypothetical protein